MPDFFSDHTRTLSKRFTGDLVYPSVVFLDLLSFDHSFFRRNADRCDADERFWIKHRLHFSCGIQKIADHSDCSIFSDTIGTDADKNGNFIGEYLF